MSEGKKKIKPDNTTYLQTQVHEPVEVIAHFHNLKIDILKFKWNNQVYKVDRVTNRWKISNGDGFLTRFLVICEKQEVICELSFNNIDMKWELVQYDNLV